MSATTERTRDERGRILPGHTLPGAGGRPLAAKYDRARLLRALEVEDYEPIREMIRIARAPEATPFLRFECAREIASYVYPKRRSVVINDGESDAVIRVVWDDPDTAKQTLDATHATIVDAIQSDDDC